MKTKSIAAIMVLTTVTIMLSCIVISCGSKSEAASANDTGDVLPGEPEKPQLTLGFIKLTDMAPLAIA